MSAQRQRIGGIVAAVATPVDGLLEPDVERFLAHARRLFDEGCDGLNVLGTTGQMTSFSAGQRLRLMAAVANAGLPLGRIMCGTGAANVEDAVRLTQSAVELGFGGALVIPPFYYKNVGEDGVFDFFAALLGRVEGPLRLYLYNFPAMSAVPFTPPLVARLVGAFGERIAGLKDSSQDLAYESALREAHPGFDVFAASESQLLEARTRGLAGAISATLNVTAAAAAHLWREPAGAAASERQAGIARIRGAISSVPLVPAVHHLLARRYRDDAWLRVLPPLRVLHAGEQDALDSALARAGYRSEAALSA